MKENMNVRRVEAIRTQVWVVCPVCQQAIGSVEHADIEAEKRVNHILQEHGWSLIHVGQETTDANGDLVQGTVYVLGEPR